MYDHASMNRAYRLVWSDRLDAYVVAAETARGRGQRAVRRAIASLLAGVIAAGTAQAQSVPPPAATQLPTGGRVVAGQAGITQNAARLDIHQSSNRAAIDWQTFNVGAQAHVNFNQPGAQSVILNRVLDAQPSQIFGRITANGQVYLSNPNGVYFSPSASVDVGGLAATTHHIGVAEFMAGKSTFERNGAAGAVVNQGNLKASLGGYIALLAPEVRNEGVVIAHAGTVAFAAGESITLKFSGGHTLAGVTVTPSQIKALVDNRHAVLAPGGLIVLSAQAADRVQGGVVRNSGMLEAQGIAQRGGRIVLDTSDRVENLGVVRADAGSDGGPAGSIHVSANSILNTGVISAAQHSVNSPAASGGEITLHATKDLNQAAGGLIDASSVSGNGGGIVLKADYNLDLAGTVRAASVTASGGRIVASAPAALALSAVLDVSGGERGGQIQLQSIPAAPGLPVPATQSTVMLTNGTQLRAGSSRGRGGLVTIEGDTLHMAPQTRIDASGASGGGTVLVGGDWQGSGPMVQASRVTMDKGAVIDVSATHDGDGGKAVLWSNLARSTGATLFNGAILATGKRAGGQVETSGHSLGVSGKVITGGGGQWLLDPFDVIIDNASSTNVDGSFNATGSPAVVHAGSIAAALTAGSNVTVSTGSTGNEDGNITVNASIVTGAMANPATLTLKADRNIVMNAGSAIDATQNGNSKALNVVLWANASGTGRGGIVMESNGAIRSNGGNIVLGGGSNIASGFAIGAGIGEEGRGIWLREGTLLDAGGGNITLRGRGQDGGEGIVLGEPAWGSGSPGSSVLVTSGMGFIDLTGSGTTAENRMSTTGIKLHNDVRIQTQSGAIHVTGSGGDTLRSVDDNSGLLFGPGTRILSAGGPITLAGDVGTGNSTEGSGIRALGGGVNYIGHDGGTNLGASASDIFFKADAMRLSGATTTVNTSGALAFQPNHTSFVTTFDWSGAVSGGRFTGAGSIDGMVIDNFPGIAALTLGKSGDVAGIAINGEIGPLPLLTLSTSGMTTQTARVLADNLQLNGTGGDYLLNHIDNRVGTLAASVDTGSVVLRNATPLVIGTVGRTSGVTSTNGSVYIETAAGQAMTVEQPILAPAPTLIAGGDLTLNAGVTATLADLLLSAEGRFVNNAGSGALATPGRWLVYSNSPYANTFGGLVSGNSGLFGKRAADYGPGELAMDGYNGNRYLFANSETIAVTTLNAANTYGDAPPPLAGRYAVAPANTFGGVILAPTISGAPVIASAGASATAHAGSYAITADVSAMSADAPGYNFVAANSGVYTVAPRPLTLSGSRVYDATTAIAASLLSLGNIVNGDTVTVTGNGTLSGKNVGTQALGSPGSLTLSNSDYTLAGAAAAVTITPASLAVTGVAAQNKVYDATVNAALTGSAQVTPLGSDAVTVGGNALAQFADKHAGNNKAVSVSGYTLLGADAGNYVLQQPAGLSATISPAALAVTGVTAQNKLYDATTAAALSGTAQVSPLGTDAVAVGGNPIARFGDKNAGNNKSVAVSGYTLQGADASNYILVPPAGLTANISPATLTVSGVTAQHKVYDATLNATLTGMAQVTPLGSDWVTVGGMATAQFGDKNVGQNKAVSAAGYALQGADAGNYVLVPPAGLTANISPATLTVSGITAQHKVYDATLNATLTGMAQVTPLDSDRVTVGGMATAQFGDKNVGQNKAVSATGYTLQGADAGNYVLIPPAGLTANISPATLAVSGIAAQNKVYDATAGATLSGSAQVTPLGADAVQLAGSATAMFGDKNVGTNKAVSVSGYTLQGADAGNYTLVPPAGLSASISPLTLAVSGVTAQNKVYDGTNKAAVSGNAAVTALGADTIALAGNAVATFDDANVGNNKRVFVGGYTLAGVDAANYLVAQPAGLSANIIAVPALPAAPANATALPAWPPLPMTETRGDLMQLAVQGGGAALDVSALLPAPVIVAEAAGTRSGEYHFALPGALQALLEADALRTATATRTDRAPLPAWLRFDPAGRKFVATTIPPNVLPMQLLLTVGTQSHRIEIALSSPSRDVVARTAAHQP